ncbi:MAG: hypothetical protein E6L02_07660 [Thaumarchaeota archaeon]|nr:MAG: hypothetical protein E6L02_07660 [Nitrososphaerota archaeon]
MSTIVENKVTENDNKVCPKCGKPCYGRYVKQFNGHKYWYFAHAREGLTASGKRGLKWCYGSVVKLEVQEEACAIPPLSVTPEAQLKSLVG